MEPNGLNSDIEASHFEGVYPPFYSRFCHRVHLYVNGTEQFAINEALGNFVLIAPNTLPLVRKKDNLFPVILLKCHI